MPTEASLRARFEINIDYRDRVALAELIKSTPQEDRYRLGRQSVAEIIRNLVVGYLTAVQAQPTLGSREAVPVPWAPPQDTGEPK
jgi:CTP synthase (UTP-ammonia lyase)